MFIGWHNVEAHDIPVNERGKNFTEVFRFFMKHFEAQLVLLVPYPHGTIYFSKHLVSYDHQKEKPINWKDPKLRRIRNSLENLFRAEAAYLTFSRFCRSILYGNFFRGWADPGIRANNGRFVGILAPITVGLKHLLEKFSVPVLLKGTGLPVDVISLAVY